MKSRLMMIKIKDDDGNDDDDDDEGFKAIEFTKIIYLLDCSLSIIIIT